MPRRPSCGICSPRRIELNHYDSKDTTNLLKARFVDIVSTTIDFRIHSTSRRVRRVVVVSNQKQGTKAPGGVVDVAVGRGELVWAA